MFLVAILLVPLFFLHESELATDNFSVRFPSEHWLRYQTPEDAGWDALNIDDIPP